jgi:cysteine-rich repeat protein
LQVANVDQVQLVSQTVGGAVIHRGAAGDPTTLTAASQYSGPVDATTRVEVTIPSYIVASSVIASNVSGNSEPGNIPSVILGWPTDMTYTAPGTGNPDPDGTAGDGSLVMGASGNFVTVSFGVTISYSACAEHALILFTDTAGPGSVRVELLSSSGSVIDSYVTSINGGAAKSAIGGVVFRLNNLTFDQVRVTRLSGTVEIDAVAVRQSTSGDDDGEGDDCGDGEREGGEECDDGDLEDDDGCSSACRGEDDLAIGSQFCTLTQGAWGAPSGIGNGPNGFLTLHPDILPVTIGGPDQSTTVRSQEALIAYLPKGGTPTELLPGERDFWTAADVVDDGGGVLAAQTTALALAINLSNNGGAFEGLASLILPDGHFCTQKVTAGADGVLGTADDQLDSGSPVSGPWSIHDSVAAVNNTVGDLLIMANQYLRGGSSAPSISDVNNAVSTINEAFDECRQVVECPDD